MRLPSISRAVARATWSEALAYTVRALTGCLTSATMFVAVFLGPIVIAQEPPGSQQPTIPEIASSQAAAQEAPALAASKAYGKIQFEPHVREILSAHCVECHGAKQAKGSLRVDDRDGLLGYITAGDLAGSPLWTDYLTTSDEELHMPPLKHGNQLSPLELSAIRVWIEDGADWPEGYSWPSGDGAAAVQPAISAPADQLNLAQKGLVFIGFFHPAIVHFPIALLLISGLFVTLGFINRETFEPAAFHCLWIGAVGAIVSSFAGWSFADLQGYTMSNDAVMRHRICGIAVAVLATLLTPLAMAARKHSSQRLRLIWLGGALSLAMLVSIVGHQGGELTYGEDLVGRAYQQSFGK